mmetsp:Transcript_3963/g.6239  ORF Transcript_3963/g.6239 Transcript_3963/m.6239 type:complete len:372 (-) Transcript_3963:69-1184(-)
MPPLTIPPELKKITPYVRRAEEVDRDKANPESRLVAYYCRQYAVHIGISLATSTEGKTCLGELLGNLEGEKQVMSAFTKDEAKFLCSKFANKIFDKADLEDRTGDATKATAKTFYAAGSFLDILQQFYQDDDDSEELAELRKKAIYAKWKSTEILKALKEGRKPTPGGYGEEEVPGEEEQKEEEQAVVGGGEEEEVQSPPKDPSPKTATVETVSDDDEEEEEQAPPVLPTDDEPEKQEEGTEVELGPPPAYPDAAPSPIPPPSNDALPPPIHKPPLTFNPPPAVDFPPPPPSKPVPPPSKNEDYDDVPAASQSKKTSFFNFGGGRKKKDKLTKAELADATELTKFALAALSDKDADLAAERLQQALQVLGR